MKMQKTLLSGLFWIMLLNLMIKPLWLLGIEVGVQNAVGAEMYGFYFAIFNLSFIFNILLDLGITNFNTRNIAQSPILVEKHISGILGIKIALLGLYVLVTFSVGALLGYDSRQFKLLAWLCINQFLNSMILYLRSNFEALMLFKWDSVLSVLDRILMVVICGFLLWGPFKEGFKIEWFVGSQTIAYLITVIIALGILIKKTGFHKLTWNKAFGWMILKQSFPYALLVLLMASYNRLDPVLLEWLLPNGSYAAGIYASAFRLLDALAMIGYLVSVPLLPIFSKLIKDKQTEEIGFTCKMITGFMIAFAVGATITLSWIGLDLMEVLYWEHTIESAEVFKIVIYCFIPIAMNYIYGTLLTANGSLKQLNIMASCALVLNIIINMLLIPRLGAVGSAWASLSTQTLMALMQWILAIKTFKIKFKIVNTIQLILYIGVIIVCNSLCRYYAFSWWIHLLSMTMIAIIVAIMLRMIDIRQIIKTIKNKD